ncbi:MAG: aminotransferase class V-fold PLP-dependent enzyme [Pseudomonadota bacterium]
MSLAYGRPLRAMPGPSVIPDRVLNAMHREAPSIYEGEIVEVTASISADLCRVAKTDGAGVAMYIANGHGAWEAAIANTIAPGEKILVLVTGRFGAGWGEMARAMGAEVDMMDFGTAGPADADAVAARLKGGGYKALLTVQTDTATSVNNDIKALGAAVREASPDTLFMVDCIACLGCERFEMDAWGVDVMVAGCQKGLMTPPGMAFVFANARAQGVRKSLTRVSPYFDWAPRLDPAHFYQNFFGTAPTHHLYGLRTALDMLFEEGLENVFRRHDAMAACVWAAGEVWAKTGAIRLNIPDRAARSVAVTTFLTGADDATRLRTWCEAEAGVTLGLGIGLSAGQIAPGDSAFRIGHMGHLNPPMLLGVLGTVDAGLKALGIAHGGGALRCASEAIAAAASEPVPVAQAV